MDLPWNNPSSYWGIPMTMETPNGARFWFDELTASISLPGTTVRRSGGALSVSWFLALFGNKGKYQRMVEKSERMSRLRCKSWWFRWAPASNLRLRADGHTDHAGGFQSKALLVSWCTTRTVLHTFTPGNQPQSNRRAEAAVAQAKSCTRRISQKVPKWSFLWWELKRQRIEFLGSLFTGKPILQEPVDQYGSICL